VLKSNYSSVFLAVLGGALLALMIAYNSKLATYSSPLIASWFAHGIGTAASILFLLILACFAGKKTKNQTRIKAPFWVYFGGIPGSMTVVLAAVTVNSVLGLSGSLVLMLAGKFAFGLVCDSRGHFGVNKRKLSINDLIVVLTITLGSVLIIVSRR
jgi:transporter family-2 protein